MSQQHEAITTSAAATPMVQRPQEMAAEIHVLIPGSEVRLY
jgi:hypothetical protein